MESERLQSGWEQAAKAIVIVSLGEKSGDTIALVRHLISEASNHYPQLSELNLLPVPLPVPQLETWTYWLAAQTVSQWRDMSVESISTEAFASELGLINNETTNPLISALDKTATGTSLSAELASRLQLCEQQSQRHLSNSSLHQWLEQEVVGLSDWFTPPLQTIDTSSIFSNEGGAGCLSQLQANAVALRSKSRLQLQEFFVSLRHAGPRAGLKLLKNLGETFTSICVNYEARKQNCLRREGAAWRAYYSLSAQLENRSLIPRRRKVERAALLQAINKASNFKLEAEIYTMAGQVVGGLRQQTHVQAIALAQADTMLGSLQSFFSNRCPTEPIFAPILKQYLAEQVDISKLRRRIEVIVGCSLNQWGSLKSAQQTVLREQILAQIRPLCSEIYAKCYRSLIDLSPELQTNVATPSSHSLSITLASQPEKIDDLSWRPSSEDGQDAASYSQETEDDLKRDRAAPDVIDFPIADTE